MAAELRPGSSPPLRYAAADRAILSIASRQHGVVTRAQLLAAGLASGVIERRLVLKRLRGLHRGVYLVGPIESAHASALAAVLACLCENGLGESPHSSTRPNGADQVRAAASHWTALHLFELFPASTNVSPVHVSTVGRDSRRPGIRVHRVRQLPSDEVTTIDGVPVTTPARTLLDLGNAMSTRELERAVIEALGRRLTTEAALVELLSRYPQRREAAPLRAVLASGNPALARSEAETLFRRLVREAGLPEPALNGEIGGIKVDFHWRDPQLIVEVDGAAYHSTSSRFENDRRRDRTLVAAGYRVMRVTWRQMKHEQLALAVQLARALGLAAAPPKR